MLIVTLSYNTFEVIQLQREESATKSNVSTKAVFILLSVEGIDTQTLPLLTGSLQSVFSIKCMWLKFKLNWILPSRLAYVI